MEDWTSLETGKQLTYVVSAITAIGALGTAAFGLVDATKAIPGGGVSEIGFSYVRRVLDRFAAALDQAVGKTEWRAVVHAHWINGRPKDEQKAIVKSLIRLGLTPETAPALADAGHVDRDKLTAVAKKLRDGEPLVEADLNVLGRLDASVEALLDAAFDRADQRYRNVARVLAGVFSVALAVFATKAMQWDNTKLAVIAGLLAVPLAPVAKDLASSLQAAAQAVKAVKGRA